MQVHRTHQEADTLKILYALAMSHLSITEHIYSSDTDVLVLELRGFPELTRESLVTATGVKRRIHLEHIYSVLGPEKVAALPGLHALTRTHITGHIQGKGKIT